MRPGSSEGRSTAYFSESGFFKAGGSTLPANGAAASRSTNANVIASDIPQAISTCLMVRSRNMRGSGGGCGAVSVGNVPGSPTYPSCRATSSIRSISRTTSTRNEGMVTFHDVPSLRTSDLGPRASTGFTSNPSGPRIFGTSASSTVSPSTRAMRAPRSVSVSGGFGAGYRSIIAPSGCAAPIWWSRAAARAIAAGAALMSAPRSNLVDASVLSPRSLLVRRSDDGLKYALSRTITRVPLPISESAPPMTPPMACARSASAITSMSGSSARSRPSSVRILSPGFARLILSVAPFSRARSNACVGCPISIIT